MKANPLNVLLITQNFPPESVGGAVHNFEIAEHLSKLGCAVDVLTTYPTYPYGDFDRQNRLCSREKLEKINVTRIWTFQPIKPDPPLRHRLLQYLIFPLHGFLRLVLSTLFSSKRYDVVVTSHPPETILMLGYLMKKLGRMIWVAEFRDLWIEAAVSLGFISSSSVFHKLGERLRKQALQSADIFAYVSWRIRDEFVKKYKVRAKQVFNPNGVDPRRCPVCDKKNGNMIYVGNIGHAYSLENVITSLSYIKNKNLKLLIAGGGDKKVDLLRLVDELDLNGRVEFVGILSHDQVLDLISKSVLGLHAQKELDFLEPAIPIKVLEYMGCGVPFVAIGRGEIERLAKDSQAGLVVGNEPKEIASAIDSLIEDRGLLRKMGENGRDFVGREFNMPKTVSELHQAILKNAS